MKQVTDIVPLYEGAEPITAELIKEMTPEVPLQWIQNASFQEDRLVIGGRRSDVKMPGLVSATLDGWHVESYEYAPNKMSSLFPIIGIRLFSVNTSRAGYDPRMIGNQLDIVDSMPLSAVRSFGFYAGGVTLTDDNGEVISAIELGISEDDSKRTAINALQRVRATFPDRVGKWVDQNRYAAKFEVDDQRFMVVM